MIDFQVTDDERLLAEAAERFGGDHLQPNEREHEHACAYPRELREAYAEQGFSGAALPEELGGGDLSWGLCAVLWARLAAADPAAPIGLDPYGPGARVLAGSSTGRDLLERQAEGWVAVAPHLRRDGERITARLPWVPRASLEWVVVLDADDPEQAWLVLDPPTEPLVGRPCGLQAAGGVEVVLEGVTAEPLSGSVQALAECRVFAASLLLGAAQDAHRRARTYAMERVAFGKPVAHHQGLAFQLVEAATRLDAAELVLGAAAARGDAVEIANAHAYVAEVAQHVAERSVQTLGGHGYLYDHPVEKRMRAIRSLATLWGGAAGSETCSALGVLDLRDPLEVTS